MMITVKVLRRDRRVSGRRVSSIIKHQLHHHRWLVGIRPPQMPQTDLRDCVMSDKEYIEPTGYVNHLIQRSFAPNFYSPSAEGWTPERSPLKVPRPQGNTSLSHEPGFIGVACRAIKNNTRVSRFHDIKIQLSILR